jgi:hypothetical protein
VIFLQQERQVEHHYREYSAKSLALIQQHEADYWRRMATHLLLVDYCWLILATLAAVGMDQLILEVLLAAAAMRVAVAECQSEELLADPQAVWLLVYPEQVPGCSMPPLAIHLLA